MLVLVNPAKKRTRHDWYNPWQTHSRKRVFFSRGSSYGCNKYSNEWSGRIFANVEKSSRVLQDHLAHAPQFRWFLFVLFLPINVS